MADPSSKQGWRNLVRFYRLAVPYWKLVAVSLLAMLVYSAASFNIVLLIGPTLAAFQKAAPPDQAAGGGLAAALAAGQAPAREPAKAQDFLQATRERAERWVRSLGIVRAVESWLWAEVSLKRVAFVLAFIIGPLLLASGFLQEYAQNRVAWHVVADLRVEVFDHLSRLSLRYFSGQRTGEVLSRLTNDIGRTESALGVLFGTVFLQPMMLLFFLAGATWKSPHLALVAVAASPLVVFLMGRYGIRVRRYATRTLQKLADVTDSVTQVLNGIRVVKSFHMEEAEREEFRGRNMALLQKAFKLVRTQAWAGVLPEFILGVLSMSLILLFADRLVRQGKLPLQNMLMCVAYLTLCGGRVRRIVRAYVQLQQSMASVNRVFELIDARPDIEDAPDAVEIDGVHQGVWFDNVWFAYDRIPVLRGIDLHVPCGKTYAIVGETGAGKSTMLDLIPRFYDVAQGSVSIDGVDVRRIKRKSLMQQIAIVGQRPFLFNRSIAENIRYGKRDATDEEVVAAARAANIHDFIQSLPEGYDTVAGEAGDRFSGGQRQCITVARAVLKNAPILILDEATSSLDAESEMLVQRALDNLMADRTTFVIAHRLSTVRHADRIIVLRDGRIVEQGAHEELLHRHGEYQRLYRLQFADTGPGERASEAGA
jgi:subfamily B ATP-binding cassette protein MsbA